jgi:hypothetical protein
MSAPLGPQRHLPAPDFFQARFYLNIADTAQDSRHHQQSRPWDDEREGDDLSKVAAGQEFDPQPLHRSKPQTQGDVSPSHL